MSGSTSIKGPCGSRQASRRRRKRRDGQTDRRTDRQTDKRTDRAWRKVGLPDGLAGRPLYQCPRWRGAVPMEPGLGHGGRGRGVTGTST